MDLLDSLVTSNARRELVRLLWGEGVAVSVKEASQLCGLGFASAHRELRHLAKAGLATKKRMKNATIYCSNAQYPQATLLRSLVGGTARKVAEPTRQALVDSLAALGAPLDAHHRLYAEYHHAEYSTERLLAAATALARSNGAVAMVLPYVIFRQAKTLRFGLLKSWAKQYGETSAVGMFVELAAELGDEPRLRSEVRRFRDKRVRRTRDFFVDDTSPTARAVAEMNTPAIAKRWRFSMNMPLDSMRSVFEKQGKVRALRAHSGFRSPPEGDG